MRVAFRADASSLIGTGHVMRCLTLADELAVRGAQTLFISRSLPGHLAELIRGRGHECALLPAPAPDSAAPVAPPLHAHWLSVPVAQDAAETEQALREKKWDWLVVDHYALDAAWERLLRQGERKLLVIDDLADRPHDCDLLLDTNLQDSAERYRELLPPACGQLLGPRYALLRPQFAAARARLRSRDGSVQRLLIYYGGVDPSNLTGMTLEAVAQAGGALAVDVVLAKNLEPSQRHQLVRRCAELSQVSIHTDVSDMAALMTQADLAFGAAGVTTWERAAMGLPAIIVTVAQNQNVVAAGTERAGLVTWVGDVSTITADKLAQALRRALSAPQLLAAQSRCGMDQVDGGGASRVGEAMAGGT